METVDDTTTTEDAGGRGEAGRLAEQLRANLTARLDVETLLAEASAARQAAVVDAAAIVAQAQQVSRSLLSDSRAEAERVGSAARAEADRIVAQARTDADAVRRRAEAEVEEHRRRVHDEVTAQVTREVHDRVGADLVSMREASGAMIDDVEATVRILAVSLETARAQVDDMLSRLGTLRPPADDGGADPEPAPRSATEAYLRLAGPASDDDDAAAPSRPADPSGAVTDARPLGWLFRTP